MCGRNIAIEIPWKVCNNIISRFMICSKYKIDSSNKLRRTWMCLTEEWAQNKCDVSNTIITRMSVESVQQRIWENGSVS